MSDDVSKLLDFFSFDPATRFILHLPAGSGLSGHTSPYGECAFSHLVATPEDWLPTQLVFYFLTLAPRDYVTYCQARGLSGHTSPCGECACSHLKATSGDWLPARLVFYYSSTF